MKDGRDKCGCGGAVTSGEDPLDFAPKFSIVIPVYNVASYLRECLDSVCVAAVRFGNGEQGTGGRERGTDSVEIICVDDGSTDESGAILDEYARRQSNNQPIPNQAIFRVIHQRNAGVSAARNAGLEVATGEHLAFVDADDVLEPTVLSDAAGLIAQHPDATFVALGMRRLGEADDGKRRTHVEVLTDADDMPSRLAMTSFVQMFLRRDQVGDIRFSRYSIGEDRVYVYRVARRAKKIVLCDKVGYRYRVHDASASHSRQTLCKRWDDFRHAVHALAILLVTPRAGWRIRLRYVRAAGKKALGLLCG